MSTCSFDLRQEVLTVVNELTTCFSGLKITIDELTVTVEGEDAKAAVAFMCGFKAGTNHQAGITRASRYESQRF